jgi:hypothetical protein
MKVAIPFDIPRSELRFFLLKNLLFCKALHATARDPNESLHFAAGITTIK